jgi:uncharacterized protein YjbI with pentapeptide repeats
MLNKSDRTGRWGHWMVVGGVLALVLPPLASGVSNAGAKEDQQGAEPIRITDRGPESQKLEVTNSNISHSKFENCRAEGVTFRNVGMPRLSFEDADLSDLQIRGAQLGGALFRHIGLPPPDHPTHVAGARQRPMRFEECDLNGSTIKDSDLTGVAITGCKMQGMTIDGIRVSELLAAYREKQGKR